VLEGDLVRLEPLDEHHALALAAAAAESRTTYTWTWVPNGAEEARAYVAEALAAHSAAEHLPFATVARAEGRVVGSTRFTNAEWWEWPSGHPLQRVDAPDVVEIGHTFLAASAQRTGINTEAKFLMLRHAFEVWEVHRVRLRTDRRNTRSRAAIERLGATLDGVMRADRVGADGTVRDSAYYSVVREEWPSVRDRLRGLLSKGGANGAGG
jgi:RimJ/RimL family protein N-acetyltransferase